MKLFNVAFTAIIALAFTSCSDSGKKVLIMASGKITVDDKDQKNIKLQPGSTHTEKQIILTDGGKETLTVQSPDGNKTFDVTEAGLYLLNLKPDTLVGAMVKYGAGARTSNLTGEDVDHIIDSTQKLVLGQNVSDDSKTYFVVPNTLKKLSKNIESRIVGPYNGIPGSVGEGSEVFKFDTNKQKREALDNLVKERKK